MIDYDKFKKSLERLEVQYKNYTSLDPLQPLLIQEAVAESVIQRFETCYDCLWKVLKRYMHEQLGIPTVPNSPKPLLRMAHENTLLASPIETWLSYAEARIGTSHDYSGKKATEALNIMNTFIEDAITLYQTMSEKTWNHPQQ